MVFLACKSPSENSIPTQPPIEIGDPLYSSEAPIMIDFKNIKVKHQPAPPHYPVQARTAGIHGELIVEVWVNEKGIPYKSAALFGPQELKPTAAAYILKWLFEPYVENGVPKNYRFRMVMPFQLSGVGKYQKLSKNILY